jgi:regulatory protein YycH of two-component signal transduction system YycFG
MSALNYTTSFLVDKTPKEAFDAINTVRGWWTENLVGNTAQLNDEFSVRFGDVHYSKHKLTEVIPDTKVVWLTIDSRLNFIEDKTEWTGTKIVFDISKQGDQTEVRFTQLGLNPEVECYSACSNAWGGYINDSLRSLITTGKGQPTEKEIL